jgi:hypothetical protein
VGGPVTVASAVEAGGAVAGGSPGRGAVARRPDAEKYPRK